MTFLPISAQGDFTVDTSCRFRHLKLTNNTGQVPPTRIVLPEIGHGFEVGESFRITNFSLSYDAEIDGDSPSVCLVSGRNSALSQGSTNGAIIIEKGQSGVVTYVGDLPGGYLNVWLVETTQRRIDLLMFEEQPNQAVSTTPTMLGTQSIVIPGYGGNNPTMRGRWLVSGSVELHCAGATFPASRDVTIELNDSINGAIATSIIKTPAVTTSTQSLPAAQFICHVDTQYEYSDHTLSLRATISTAPTAGSLIASRITMTAMKIGGM